MSIYKLFDQYNIIMKYRNSSSFKSFFKKLRKIKLLRDFLEIVFEFDDNIVYYNVSDKNFLCKKHKKENCECDYVSFCKIFIKKIFISKNKLRRYFRIKKGKHIAELYPKFQ